MPKKQPKEITLNKQQAKVGGVSSGIAKYYKKDPVWVRIWAVILIILTGIIPGLIIYGVFYLLMKESDEK